MSELIQFYIPFGAVPKQSVRVGKGRAWTDPKITQNAHLLATYALQFKPERPIPREVPIRVRLQFEYAWLTKHPDKVRTGGCLWKRTKPDCDNLAKQVLDVLEHLQFFEDDSQIAELHIRKQFTDAPGVWIELEELPDEG